MTIAMLVSKLSRKTDAQLWPTCNAEDSHALIADGNHGRQCQDSLPGQREIWGRRVALASGHHNEAPGFEPVGQDEKAMGQH